MFRQFKKHNIRNEITFKIQDVPLEIVNALRRVIISELNNVAVHFDPYNNDESDIKFIENTSCLHNEFLGHRLSLIPLHFDEKEVDQFQKEKYLFEINVHNKTHDDLEVTTNDIRIKDENGNEYPEEFHKKIFPVSSITKDPILIVILNPNHYNLDMGEKLNVQFRASIGKALKHARYSPVSTCTYFNVIDDEKVKIAKEKYIEEKQKELDDKNEKLLSKEDIDLLKKRFDVHDAYRYFQTNEYDEPNAFEFTLESECRLSHKYLVSKAIDVLIDKMDNILEKRRHKISNIGSNAYSILIKGEQHTLGNLIQGIFYNNYIRPFLDKKDKKDQLLTYIGYYLVHPLSEEILFKMNFSDDKINSVRDVENFLKKGFQELQNLLRHIQTNWEKEIDSFIMNKIDTNEASFSNNGKSKKTIRKIKKQT